MSGQLTGQLKAEASERMNRPAQGQAFPQRCDACKSNQALREPAGRSAPVSGRSASDGAPGNADGLFDSGDRLPSGSQPGHSISRITVMASGGAVRGASLPQMQPRIGSSPPIQAKLVISQPGDALEQEADRIADKVMANTVVSGAPQRIQRYAGQTTGGTNPAFASVDSVLVSSGRPLEIGLQQDMEQRFGHDFSRVRIHLGGDAEHSAREMNASAYTVGHNIVFGAGRFAPGTDAGLRLIAHELTHVVQQSGSNCCLSRTHLQTIADDFKAKVNADPAAISGPDRNITDTGQNFWTSQIWDRIDNLIDAEISAPLQSDLKGLAEANAQLNYKAIAEKTKKVTQDPAYKTDQKAQKLFFEPDLRSGKEIYDTWWYIYRTKKTLPDLSKYLSFPILRKISLYEIQACAATVGNVFEVYKKGGGAGKGMRDPKNAFSGRLFASAIAQRDACRVDSNRALGDIVKYVPLDPIIAKMKAAIDDGFALHTHVLSGYGIGSDAPMTDCSSPESRKEAQKHCPAISGEHYILIIGYEGNKFLFWDAHASDSKELGGGFGYLFYSNGRLTTAENDNDLPVDENGDHSGGQHRYQPLTISTK